MAYGSTHKYVLRIIDHSMIYVAIAGSYTPVVLTLMNNWFGYLIIAIQWGTTIFGILYKIFAKNGQCKIQPHSLPHQWDGLYWLSYQQSSVRQVQCFGVLWYQWPLLYSWRWILR